MEARLLPPTLLGLHSCLCQRSPGEEALCIPQRRKQRVSELAPSAPNLFLLVKCLFDLLSYNNHGSCSLFFTLPHSPTKLLAARWEGNEAQSTGVHARPRGARLLLLHWHLGLRPFSHISPGRHLSGSKCFPSMKRWHYQCLRSFGVWLLVELFWVVFSLWLQFHQLWISVSQKPVWRRRHWSTWRCWRTSCAGTGSNPFVTGTCGFCVITEFRESKAGQLIL